MFSYRRGTRGFIGRNWRQVQAFCPTVVGQGFNTRHPHDENPLFRHRISPKEQAEQTRRYLAAQDLQNKLWKARYPKGRVLPAINP